MTPPTLADISAALETVHLDRIPGATVLLSAVVGSFGRGEWEPADDVDIRLVYVLPTEAYLGLGSYWDEVEQVIDVAGLELDIVAFEVEKVARLLLKGHAPTAAWLSTWELRLRHEPAIEPLVALAGQRSTELSREAGQVGPISPADYLALDRVIQRLRMSASGAKC